LDNGCNNETNRGNNRVNIDIGQAGEFIVERSNTIFAIDFLTFQDTK
jgi:hypothetical protein